MPTGLATDELERDRDQPSLSELGVEGRARLRSARVLIVGAGGLGAVAAGYVAADGVGRLGIVDYGTVKRRDLGGRLPHRTSDVGRNKAESAAARIAALSPDVQADVYPVRVEGANAEAIIAGHDLVVECSSCAETRYVTNNACVALGVALVWGEVSGLRARVGTVRPAETACYRCAFPEPPTEGSELSPSGLAALGPLVGVVGSLQAAESVKLLVGIGQSLTDRVLEINALDFSFTERRIRRGGGCRACGNLERSLEEVT